MVVSPEGKETLRKLNEKKNLSDEEFKNLYEKSVKEAQFDMSRKHLFLKEDLFGSRRYSINCFNAARKTEQFLSLNIMYLDDMEEGRSTTEGLMKKRVDDAIHIRTKAMNFVRENWEEYQKILGLDEGQSAEEALNDGKNTLPIKKTAKLDSNDKDVTFDTSTIPETLFTQTLTSLTEGKSPASSSAST